VTDRVLSEMDGQVEADLIGDIRPKGFSRSVRVHAIRSLKGTQVIP
jgi:adenylate cyclase